MRPNRTAQNVRTTREKLKNYEVGMEPETDREVKLRHMKTKPKLYDQFTQFKFGMDRALEDMRRDDNAAPTKRRAPIPISYEKGGMVPTVASKKLPSKKAMIELGKSQRQLKDYAKVTPWKGNG